MRVLTLIAAVLLFPTSVFADDPLSAEAVAKAVEESRRAYLASNPPETKEQALDKLQRELDALMRSKSGTQNAASNRKFEAQKRKDIVAKRKEMNEVSKTFTPKQRTARLSNLKWSSLEVGTVGYISADTTLKVLQIVDKQSVLVTREFWTRGVNTSDPGQFTIRGPYLISNIPTDGLQEGRTVRRELNVIVTEQYRYTTQTGATKTVPTLEVFNPDEPFVSATASRK